MRITEMKAKDCGRQVRIFVSERVKNDGCDDCRPHWGWWYCVVGGQVGYFVTKRPYSGVCLQGALESHERDVFNVNGKIETKERFGELLEL